MLEKARELASIERVLSNSTIKAHKSKFERAQELYRARKEHCNIDIRSRVLKDERNIRKALANYESKQVIVF